MHFAGSHCCGCYRVVSSGQVKRLIALACAAALIFLGVVAATGPAQAKVPGPNGQIVFSSHNTDTDRNDIYLVNPDGSHLRPLSFPYDMDVPHWSPDGSKIAFNSGLDLPCPPTCVGAHHHHRPRHSGLPCPAAS
jgi:WD40-like Beta Propeller Repeat